VDVQFRLDMAEGSAGTVAIDHDLARQLVAAASEIDQMTRHTAPLECHRHPAPARRNPQPRS
jgi:hypothetical protein